MDAHLSINTFTFHKILRIHVIVRDCFTQSEQRLYNNVEHFVHSQAHLKFNNAN